MTLYRMCFCMCLCGCVCVCVCVWGSCVYVFTTMHNPNPAFSIVPFSPFEIQVYHFIAPLLQQWWPSKPACNNSRTRIQTPGTRWQTCMLNAYMWACMLCAYTHARARWRVMFAHYNDWANQACKRQDGKHVLCLPSGPSLFRCARATADWQVCHLRRVPLSELVSSILFLSDPRNRNHTSLAIGNRNFLLCKIAMKSHCYNKKNHTRPEISHQFGSRNEVWGLPALCNVSETLWNHSKLVDQELKGLVSEELRWCFWVAMAVASDMRSRSRCYWGHWHGATAAEDPLDVKHQLRNPALADHPASMCLA